jgi:hypothetical protein
MGWLYFLVGFVSFPIVAFLLIKIIVLIRNKPLTPYGLFRSVSPGLIKSYIEIQSVIKDFISKSKNNSRLYFLSVAPKFKVILTKRDYKKKTATVVLEVRNSDFNKSHYSLVKEEIVNSDVEHIERLTPRLKQPKDVQLKFELGSVFQTTAISNVIKTIYETIDTNLSEGLFVSNQDPVFWKEPNSKNIKNA